MTVLDVADFSQKIAHCIVTPESHYRTIAALELADDESIAAAYANLLSMISLIPEPMTDEILDRNHRMIEAFLIKPVILRSLVASMCIEHSLREPDSTVFLGPKNRFDPDKNSRIFYCANLYRALTPMWNELKFETRAEYRRIVDCLHHCNVEAGKMCTTPCKARHGLFSGNDEPNQLFLNALKTLFRDQAFSGLNGSSRSMVVWSSSIQNISVMLENFANSVGLEYNQFDGFLEIEDLDHSIPYLFYLSIPSGWKLSGWDGLLRRGSINLFGTNNRISTISGIEDGFLHPDSIIILDIRHHKTEPDASLFSLLPARMHFVDDSIVMGDK